MIGREKEEIGSVDTVKCHVDPGVERVDSIKGQRTFMTAISRSAVSIIFSALSPALASALALELRAGWRSRILTAASLPERQCRASLTRPGEGNKSVWNGEKNER